MNETELNLDPPIQLSETIYTPDGDGNQSDLIEHVLISSNQSSIPKKSISKSPLTGTPKLLKECETFIEVLSQMLEDNVDASIYCASPNKINISCDDPYAQIYILNKNTQKDCAAMCFIASEKIIHITQIDRCSDKILPEQGTGTDIVKKIIAVGNEFRQYLGSGTMLKIMIDSDQSELTIKDEYFDLYWLYIFATGETWYNSLGFREDKYDDNTQLINEFIDAPPVSSGKMTIREQFQKIKSDLRDPNISIETVVKYKKHLKKTIDKFNKSISPIIKGQIQTKFKNITYDYPMTAVGFGLKKKKKNKSKKKKNKSKSKKKKNKSKKKNNKK
jgi:hypothetical protein